ncbi:MAG: sugar porter family MFS transporter [Bacteroidales bacterium]|nr:sugar porter family MFS transporter [Bacteroidales bacterium]
MKKNTRLLTRSAWIAGLGGFLFGFDTAVISGAEKSIQQLFGLNGFWLGFTVAIALIGTIVGAIAAGKPADFFGRRKILMVIAILFLFSALGAALSQSWYGILVFRFLGGLSVGASSVIGPMYIAEISPAEKRGRLVILFQLNVVTGILLAFLSNYIVAMVTDQASWRWMLGVQTLPAGIFFGLLFAIPETPRWLVLKGEKKKAVMILEKLGESDASEQVDVIEESISSEKHIKSERLFTAKLKFPIILAILVAFFNQFSGINAIMYYAPRIFEMAGLDRTSSLFQSVSIGFTNLIFTIVALFIIDRVGRKKLLLIGSVGMVFTLMLVSLGFLLNRFGGGAVLIGLVGFIAFFASSQGAVIWVFISEIFPNKVRAKGQALGSLTHWLLAALVSWVFPVIAATSSRSTGLAFAFFALMMLIQFFVVYFVFPETKGKRLEQIQNDLGL